MDCESLSAWFDSAFSTWAAKPAITFLRGGQVETEMRYGELGRDAARFALLLADKGVAAGDRVIILLEKSIVALVAGLAVQKLGAVAVPLNPGFKESELRYLFNDAAPRLVITDPVKAGMVHLLAPRIPLLAADTRIPYQDLNLFGGVPAERKSTDVGPEDPALIIYTSGTTGDPKGAVLTHGNLVHDARNIIRIWEITDADRLCHALPLFHVHGLCFALNTALLSGAGVVMPDRFDPSVVLDLLTGKGPVAACTVFMAVPAMYTRLMDGMASQGLDFSHVRLLTSGSAPLLVQEFERIRRLFGQAPVEREGMSETGMNFSNPLRGEKKPGSIGMPLPGLAVRIVDPDTRTDVPSGRVGEIWLKGPAITPGYWRNPEATRAAFADGWFRTGDLGRVDTDGYHYLTDRIKHIIITGGENVSAKEVETVINRMPGVVESAVVGVADPKWGERVAAAVVLRPGIRLREADVIAFCRERLHDWKCPKTVRFVGEIPKNTMGKVLKETVKTLFAGVR